MRITPEYRLSREKHFSNSPMRIKFLQYIGGTYISLEVPSLKNHRKLYSRMEDREIVYEVI